MLVVAATTSLVVVAFAIPLAVLVRDVARDRAITAAERDVTALGPLLAVTEEQELIVAAIGQTSTGRDGRLAVFVEDGQIGDQEPPDDQALDLAREGNGFSQDTAGGAEIYNPVITGTDETAVVRARVPNRLLDDGVRTAWMALAGVGIALIAAGCLLADRLARTVTREADDLASTARALAGGDPDARAHPSEVPEIGDVGRALNVLADRIDGLRRAERERVADLSHRLRTPLTALRLDADRAGLDAVIAAVDRLERDISEVIREARRPLHGGLVDEPCDLAAVVRGRTSFWQALADDDGRPSRTTLVDEPLPIAVTEEDAVAMVDALLTNVFTHTPDGTGYNVELRDVDGRAQLSVSDEGPGIIDLDAAAERGTSDGGSTGLGLDIVRSTATRGGGTVHFGSTDDRGLTVVVEFPLVLGNP